MIELGGRYTHQTMRMSMCVCGMDDEWKTWEPSGKTAAKVFMHAVKRTRGHFCRNCVGWSPMLEAISKEVNHDDEDVKKQCEAAARKFIKRKEFAICIVNNGREEFHIDDLMPLSKATDAEFFHSFPKIGEWTLFDKLVDGLKGKKMLLEYMPNLDDVLDLCYDWNVFNEHTVLACAMLSDGKVEAWWTASIEDASCGWTHHTPMIVKCALPFTKRCRDTSTEVNCTQPPTTKRCKT